MQLENSALSAVVTKLQDQLIPYLKSQGVQFTPAGKFKCINPAHDDSTPSTSIVPGTQDRIWHCFGALSPDELVWTPSGLKQINELVINDTILSGDSCYEKVLNKIEKQRTGLAISSHLSKEPLVMSKDHICITVGLEQLQTKRNFILKQKTRTKYSSKARNRKAINKYSSSLRIEMKLANELRVNQDYILFPIHNWGSRLDIVTTPIYNSSNYGPRPKNIEVLKLDNNTLFVLGLWLAEGSIATRGVWWTFNLNDEKHFATQCKNWCEALGLNATISEYKQKNTIEVHCSSVHLADIFNTLFGNGALNKTLPTWVQQLNQEQKTFLFNGWMAGDGDKRGYSASTISKNLAYGMLRLAIDCEFLVGLTFREAHTDKNNVHHQDSYTLQRRETSGLDAFFETIGPTKYLFSKITDITKLEEESTYIDIEVTGDHTFLTAKGATHNCQTSGTIFHAAHFLQGYPVSGLPWLNTTIKKLCEQSNIEQPEIVLTPEEEQTLEIYGIYEDAARIIRCSTMDTIVPQFEERGWDSTVGPRYGIGFVESYTKFIEQLRACGYTLEELQKANLAKAPGTNATLFDSDNLIYTIFDHAGAPVAFSARNAKYDATPDKTSKYINSPTSLIYHKREVLYGLNISKGAAQKKGLIIVEGQPDWITLQEKGIKNCAAVCGTSLTHEHLKLIESLGIDKIYLCLDNDNGGQEAVKRILKDIVAGHSSIAIDIIQLPEDQDPDEYLHGLTPVEAVAKWGQLIPISCFKWQLMKDKGTTPKEDLCRQMIPLILNEPMPITRERYAQDLSDYTGIRLKAIQDELDQLVNEEAFKHSERINSILRSAVKDITKSPSSALQTLTQTVTTLEDLQKTTSTDSLGVSESSKAFEKMIGVWKSRQTDIIGIRTFFPELDEVLNGLQEGRAVGIGGKPNHGKSAFVTNLAYNVVKYNPDVMVIMHTVDDSRETFLARMMAVDTNMEIDAITNPWKHLRAPDSTGKLNWVQEKTAKHTASAKLIKGWVDSGRLIVKDSTHGTSLAYTESLIKHYKQLNPEKRILVLFDNFHKASDYPEVDERIRYKRMSNYIKLLSERYYVAIAATMEYTKLEEGTKPGNSNLAETVQMEYDLSVIIHVYNSVKDIGKEKAILKIPSADQKTFFPIVELKVSKNKQGSFDGTLYYSFYPNKGKFEEYPRAKVQQDFFKTSTGNKFGNLTPKPTL